MTTNLQERQIVTLPEGFTERGAALDDLNQALTLMNLCSQHLIGEDDLTDVNDLITEMTVPDFNPQEDLRLIFAPNGEMVGYKEVWTTSKPPVHPWIWGCVHPQYEGLGIGTRLMQWAEERALKALPNVPDDLRFAPRTSCNHEAKNAARFFEGMGYTHIRSFYRMQINMDQPMPEPVWPQGITLRTYDPEKDAEAVYRADVESFRDHFGFVEQPFEEGLRDFIHVMTKYDGFDPALWFLAMDGDEIAGICLCRPHGYEDPDIGLVNILGVRRPWRNQGLGLALLRHAFNEFYRRGKRKAGLGVDAQNLTGALHLYEKAGMHVSRQYDSFEKEIRPGKEISVQSL